MSAANTLAAELAVVLIAFSLLKVAASKTRVSRISTQAGSG
jgi:hypothetical protein